MKYANTFNLLLLIVILPIPLQARATEKIDLTDSLVAGFLDPPKVAKPSMYWLWLNGYVNRDYLETELKQYSEKGIGGLCIFDMGARGDARAAPSAGPAFMSDEFIDNIAYTLELAGKFDLDVQLAACSSWDLGGSWVQPRHASMGLYHTKIRIKGPVDYDKVLPFPELPPNAPKTPEGKPAFLKNVAVLAIPEAKRQPAHEFIFKLPGTDTHSIDHVILYNAQSDNPKRYGKLHLFAKDFSVAVSTDSLEEQSFREIVRDRLKPNIKPQRFNFKPAEARYVRLRIYNGHNTEFDMVQLAEFEVYDINGRNVAASKEIDRTKDSALIIFSNSQRTSGAKWNADNLNDGQKSGPNGTWLSVGPPPLVIEDRSRILDLTKMINAEGKLTWKAPPGEWTIIRFVCANTGENLKVPSPNSDGLATDHFNHEATRAFIQHITSRLKQKIGDLESTPLKQLYLPSYEVRGATWTPDFIEQFEKYCHYDMMPYLPALAGCVIENQDITSRFLYDYRKMLGDLLVDAYYRTASETANQAGLGIEAEAGGPGPPVHQVPVDALKALGSIDEMRGEFWPWRQQRNQLWVVKETACAAHIYGRKRVHMEAFTGFRHWQDGPFDLKDSADRAFCEGMNHVVWHTSSHQPPEAGKPGWVYGAGTHLTPNLTWWSKAKPFIDYLSRCSFMLQQGLFVADVCYYYGDQGFNFVPAKHIDPSLGYGYDYDVVNSEVILERMSVKDGRFTLPDGMQYELLVLPDRKDMNLQVLQKIEKLVKAGGTVVGPKPAQSNGLTNYPVKDQQVKKLADLLWGNCDGKNVLEHRYGNGKITWGRSLRDILLARGIGPDFHYTRDERRATRDERREAADLDFIHRRTSEADIYFIRNRKNRREFVNAHFRVSGKAPELWQPDTGTILQQPIYEQTPEGIRVPLEFSPFDSLFVVFRKPVSRPHLVSLDHRINAATVTEREVRITAFENGSYKMKTSNGRTIRFEIDQIPSALQLTGPWNVYFGAGWGAPDSVTFAEMKSWTEHENPGIRNFSGTACYKKNFRIPQRWFGKDKKIYLDLGQLWALGEVTLNDRSLGIVWKPPYRIEITEAAKPDQNKLEVEITNTWANRLVGDAHLPSDKRFCKTNITYSGTPGKAWKDIPLRQSGLFGPVQLIQAVEKTISLTK
ncbi:MAG: hypothetical protein CEE38_16190 [Planctomycetes bacterium B3_Pla]|nr:MAG: hypothetical protein CEE38_16190 [Planctomycetes bacterium B3_Pla]